MPGSGRCSRSATCPACCTSNEDARTLRVAGKPVRAPAASCSAIAGTATDITVETAVRREVRLLERKALEDFMAKAELERQRQLERRVEARTHEREAALAQLFQAQKMEAVGKLTGGVAHDFNNLLMAVLTSLDLLGKRLPDEPAVTRLIAGAIQAAERGATLTQRLLAFARRQDLQPRPVDLPALVRGLEVCCSARSAPGADRDPGAGAPPPAMVDPHQLELALLNLAVNARDAMPLGGTLTVTLTQDQVGADLGRARARPLPADRRDRHRGRHGRGDAAPRGRAVLLDQGPRQGHRPGAVHGARPRRPVRRCAPARQPAWRRRRPACGCRETTPSAAEEQMPTAASGHRVTRHPGRRDDVLVRLGTACLLEELGHTVVEAADGPAALEILRERATSTCSSPTTPCRG